MNSIKSLKNIICGPFPRGLGPIASRPGRNGARTFELRNGAGIAGDAMNALGKAWQQAVGDCTGAALALSLAAHTKVPRHSMSFPWIVLTPFKAWHRLEVARKYFRVVKEIKLVAACKFAIRNTFREIAKEAARVSMQKIWQMEDGEAIADYTGMGYVEINKALRSNDPFCDPAFKMDMTQELQDRVDAILLAMSKLPVFKGKRLYRGADLSFGQALKAGDEFQDMAFLSTSKLRGKAFKRQVLFVIENFMTGVNIMKHSVAEKEKEILFPPGTRFRIKKVKEQSDGSPTEVFMEEIPIVQV